MRAMDYFPRGASRRPHRVARSVIFSLVLGLLVALASAASDSAEAHAKGQKAYYFLVHEIKLAEDVPAEIQKLVRTRLTKAIKDHARLVEALPPDAPDPKADPKAFARYIKKNKIRPFRVNVEVTEYSHEVEEMPAGRRGQRLTVEIALRTFGETMPKRVMAFSGEGSATIKVEIGKKLRTRDSKYANREAVQLAVADALRISLKRLEEKPKKKKKKRKKRKKRRKK